MLIRRAYTIGFGINDYASRLANTETEKFQMQESLLAAQRLEEWGRMSAILAHEISNPLEAVQNALHIIKSTAGVSTEVINLAQTAADEAARVTTISRSTLSFFRQTTEPESIDLAAAAESVRFLLDPLLRERGITFEVCTTGDVKVEAFPGETRQVLLNLVRNACEATSPPGSLVSVHITGQSSTVEIVIADQGSGIAPGALSTLFQFGMSTKGERGNGMGLWTVKRILTKHGGDIKAESTLGEGTRFTLWWPRAYASREASSAASGNAPTASSSPTPRAALLDKSRPQTTHTPSQTAPARHHRSSAKSRSGPNSHRSNNLRKTVGEGGHRRPESPQKKEGVRITALPRDPQNLLPVCSPSARIDDLVPDPHARSPCPSAHATRAHPRPATGRSAPTQAALLPYGRRSCGLRRVSIVKGRSPPCHRRSQPS